MKLRIRGNSLRLRLTRPEIAELIKAGTVEDHVQLGAQPDCALAYCLELSDKVTRPAVCYETFRICIQLPAAEGINWANSDKVGIYHEETWGLKLLVEKDFKCLDPRLGEDETGAYENPNGTTHAGCGLAPDP